MSGEEFEAVRTERDPLRQGRMATELLATYQQRSVELARLRKEAIDRAQRERGLSYAAVAAELGLSKGRIGQIRTSGPPVERAFFGVGPVTVAVPLRSMRDRSLPVLAGEDALAAERMTELLHSLQFTVEQFRIPPDGQWTPSGDTVAICGPKSSPVTAEALQADPLLNFHQSGDRWVIEDRSTAETFTSPMDDGRPGEDIAYLGRLPVAGASILLIAGVHALGSVGAVDYLSRNLADLYSQVRSEPFSMVVGSRHDGETVLSSEALCQPRLHQ